MRTMRYKGDSIEKRDAASSALAEHRAVTSLFRDSSRGNAGEFIKHRSASEPIEERGEAANT